MKKQQFSFPAIIFAMLACSTSPFGATPTQEPPISTETPAFTITPEATLTSTVTLTPTVTPTPTITATPTFAFPTLTVNKQAHCRYGPSTAYLHAADLYAGDTGSVRGRALYSQWLYINRTFAYVGEKA